MSERSPIDDHVQRIIDERARNRARDAEIERLAREALAQEQRAKAQAHNEAVLRQQQRQQQRPVPRSAAQPSYHTTKQPSSKAEPGSASISQNLERSTWLTQLFATRRRKVAAVVISLAVVGGGSYLLRDKVNTFLGDMSAQTQVEDHSVTYGEVNTNLDSASFAPETCMDADAALMVANFKDIEYPLVPVITTTDQKTAGPSAKIFSKNAPTGLSGDYKSAYEKDLESSVGGYASATIENLPVAIMACEDGDGAITESKDEAMIDMSKFKIIFADPSQLFNDPTLVTALYTKAGGTSDIELDPAKGEYLKYPDPAYWLMQSSDAEQVKSATAVSEAMFTETQMQAILATVEASAYSQLVDPTNHEENISFPDGADDLREAIKNAIAKRLKVDVDNITFSGSNFKYSIELPLDPATKKPITMIDPATGKSSLVGLDPTQEARIDAIEIVNGTISKPTAPDEPPSPSPTSSDKPAESAKQ